MFRIAMISDLDKLNSMDDAFEVLKNFIADESTEAFLDWEDNFFWKPWDFIIMKKHLVDKIQGIKIEIRSDEHVPPHFHVIINEYEGSYAIKSCEKLEWNISKQHEKKIKLWFKYWWKEKLIEKWNWTRPSNCEVWKIKD
jgi:Domain of unknown function (DUF4160)